MDATIEAGDCGGLKIMFGAMTRCGMLDRASGVHADMVRRNEVDALNEECGRRFAAMVEGVGNKQFAQSLGISARQVNRMLTGAQPNPIERLIRCLQAVEPEVGDAIVDFICQELGGHFVREEGIDSAAVNAVKECAEAIAAISDGQIGEMDMREIRDAISALSGLIYALRNTRGNRGS